MTALDFFISALLILGGLFGLIGSIGLLKLADAVQRLHAPTKVSTMGVGAVLIASSLQTFNTSGTLSWHEILVTVFLFATAPLSALFLAKAHLHLTVKRGDVPPTGNQSDWAGFTPDSNLPPQE